MPSLPHTVLLLLLLLDLLLFFFSFAFVSHVTERREQRRIHSLFSHKFVPAGGFFFKKNLLKRKRIPGNISFERALFPGKR